MKNDEFSYVEIIWVFFIILLASYVLYYNIYNEDKNKDANGGPHNDQLNSTNTHSGSIHQLTKSLPKDSKKINNNTSPPKLTNLYNEEPQATHSKNDIDIINKTNMLLYKDGYKSSNPTFETELINTNMSGEFTHELEQVYTQDLVENGDNNYDYNEIYDYSIKPNKGDLPIANVPLYALKDTSCSLKLSDKFNILEKRVHN
jgi:hypothetical protein